MQLFSVIAFSLHCNFDSRAETVLNSAAKPRELVEVTERACAWCLLSASMRAHTTLGKPGTYWPCGCKNTLLQASPSLGSTYLPDKSYLIQDLNKTDLLRRHGLNELATNSMQSSRTFGTILNADIIRRLTFSFLHML